MILKNYISQYLFFTRIIHLQMSYICWLDAWLVTRLGSSNNTGVSKQTHTHTKHREKDDTGKG